MARVEGPVVFRLENLGHVLVHEYCMPSLLVADTLPTSRKPKSGLILK